VSGRRGKGALAGSGGGGEEEGEGDRWREGRSRRRGGWGEVWKQRKALRSGQGRAGRQEEKAKRGTARAGKRNVTWPSLARGARDEADAVQVRAEGQRGGGVNPQPGREKNLRQTRRGGYGDIYALEGGIVFPSTKPGYEKEGTGLWRRS